MGADFGSALFVNVPICRKREILISLLGMQNSKFLLPIKSMQNRRYACVILRLA